MTKSLYRDENMVLLKLLKEHREASGMTQGEFAKALGRPQSFVSDMERGLRRLDLIQIRDICQVLGIGLVDFAARFEQALADQARQS